MSSSSVGLLTSPGIGSGLDINSIVSKLMSAEEQPLTLMDKQEASYQSELTAYGTLRSSLSTFQTAVEKLTNASSFNSLQAASAAPTTVTASALSNATAGSYSVQVNALAQQQKIESQGYADTTSAIGTGTLTFQFGTISGGTLTSGVYSGATFALNTNKAAQSVTIDTAHDSLAGIRDAIDNAHIGVTAAIINDGSTNGYHLVLTSNDSGAANSLKITTSSTGLATALGYDPAGTQNMVQTITAQNANLTVDGIAISKPSNTISDAIQGVTLNLLQTNATPTTVTVSRDTSKVSSAVSDFVSAYNKLEKSFHTLSGYNATTKQGGTLEGDFTTLTIEQQIQSVLGSTIQSLNGGQTSLGDIGVNFQADGTLSLDSTKLSAALAKNPDTFAGFFAATGVTSDSLVTYQSAGANAKPGVYAISLGQAATQGNFVGAGTAAASTIITAGTNDQLALSVDGVAANITLDANTYTPSQLAAELQTKINGASALSSAGIAVTVSQSGGQFTIASNRYGASSSVTGVGGTSASALGLTSGTATAGQDVAGTINGIAATGAGQYLTGASGTAVDSIKLLVQGSTTGGRGTVTFTQGYASKLDALISSILGSNGEISAATDAIHQEIKTVDQQRSDFKQRMTQVEANYRAEFSSMDGYVASMKQTGNYLTQQLANLPKG